NQFMAPLWSFPDFSATGLPALVNANGQNWSYTYDADGTRVRKSLDGSNYSVSFGSEYRKFASNGVTRHRVFVALPVGILQIEFDDSGQRVSSAYVLLDRQGSAESIVRPNGTPVERRKYSPWGELRNPSNLLASLTPSAQTDIGFVGQTWDAEAGAWNLNARL